jgi:hypothetical protein
MGGKTSTTTQQVQIPPEVLARYNAVNAQAQKAASKPFQIYSKDPAKFVAQLNKQQKLGIGNVNKAVGSYKPYFNEATEATRSGMASVMPGELEIEQYMNPFQQQVIDTTMDRMRQEQEQAQSGALGTAISSGAFGGDRAGIAAANLAQQQNMATGSTLAGLNAQNFMQALQTAQQQQGLNLGAEQANLARLLSGGQQMAGLGQAAQGMNLQGAEAQINAGTLAQQTEQAGLSALYNQFQQQQAYPFQVAQFLGNIAMGTGALSGSTTQTTQPYSFFSDRRLKHDIKRIGKTDEGMPIYTFKYKGDDSEQTHVGFMADEVEKHHPDAVGVDPASGYKTVDYERATKAGGGGVAGPYGAMVGSQPGVGGYVPQAYLPVGDLMVADSAGLENAQKTLAQQMEAAANFGENMIELKDRFGKDGDFWDLFSKNENSRGGVVGYASGGPAYLEGGLKPSDNPVEKESYLSDTLRDQEETKKNQMMQPGSAPGQPESTMSQIENAANTALAVANLFALSDRRAKHSIRRIGKTDDGMPIYRFKYKGDENEQTHIGFMADEVERKHPDAVSTGSDGMKRVDYGQAHKFYQGGLVRPGYAVGGGPETEEEIIRRRLLAGDVPKPMSLGDLPNARLTPATALPAEDPDLPFVDPQNPYVDPEANRRVRAGLAPTTPREATPAGDLSGLAAAAIERSGAQPTPEPGLAAARAPVDEVSEFYRTKILKQESNNRQFDENGNPLTSSAGAIGIGQVMPDTGPEAAEMAGLPWDEERFRTDADYNAALGEAYFRNMYDRFGSLDLASAAYNAGPGRLRSAMDRAGAMGGSYLDYLPEETQNYVASVTGAGSASRGVAGATSDIPAYGGVMNTLSTSGVAGGAGSGSAGEEYKGGLRLTPDKPYDERTVVGKMFYNPDGTVNKDALLSILSGIGTMASSPSRYLGSAILQGIGGAANTYAGLEQRRGEITAKNLENANTFMRQYLRAQGQGYAGTPEEYAKDVKYTGPIPGEIGFTPTTDGGPNVTSFMGVPLDPFGRGMTARTTISVDGKPVEVMAGQTYGYLDALRRKLVSDVEFQIASPETLQRVEEALANHRGQIVLADGSTVVDPTYEDAVFGAAATVRDIARTDELGLSVSDAMLGAQNSLRSTEELAKALKMLPSTGDLAPTFAFIGRIGQQLGFDVPTNAVEGYDIAAKISAGFARDAVNSLAGKVDTNTLAALTQATTANSNMSPGAIEEILAIQSGIADYNLALSIAIYEAQLKNQSANLAEIERDFVRSNNPETFIEKRRPEFKGTIQRPAEAAPEETDAATQELLRRGYTRDADGNLIPPGQQP